MTKQEVMRQVRQAKSAHIRWRAYAQAMVAGLDVEDEHAPIHHKECSFGKWYYGDGARTFGHWLIYKDIEDSHELLHAVYQLVFNACGNGEQARAAALAEQLVGISHSLLEAIALLEEEMQASSQELF